MFDASVSDSWWNGMVGDGFREDTSGAAMELITCSPPVASLRIGLQKSQQWLAAGGCGLQYESVHVLRTVKKRSII